MNSKILIASFLIMVLNGCSVNQNNVNQKMIAPNLDKQLNNLTEQLVSGLNNTKTKKIAIIEFHDIGGNFDILSSYISEELTSRFFAIKKFDIVERKLLNQILDEQKLGVSGFIDDDTVVLLGHLLGAEAILTGTITDIGKYLKINSRLISTESGTVYSVASIKVNKDDTMTHLLRRKGNINDSGHIIKKSESSEFFYYEDFSNIDEGLIPEDWVGASTLLVKKSDKYNNRKVLTNFESGKHSFTIPNIDFSGNFSFEIEMINYDYCCNAIRCEIGNLSFGLNTNGKSWFGSSKFIWSEITNEMFLLKVEKKGPVFKLFINGKEIVMIRINDFNNSSSFTFRYYSSFGIYKISGNKL